MGYRGFKARRSLARKDHAPRRSDIIRAIPRGSSRLRGRQIERRFLAALAVHPEMARLRCDARASMLEFARQLARRADYETGTARPTRQLLCREAGRSESTWKACRRRLEAWGFTGTVYPGCKRWHGQESRSDAAVYVLCLPGKRAVRQPAAPSCARTRPPTCLRQEAVDHPRARAGQKTGQGAPSGRARLPGRPAAGAPAGVLRAGPGQSLTDGWAGHLAAPFLAAGWTAGDLAYAVDHLPGGRQHQAPVRDVAHPAGWVRWRLAHWLAPGEAGLFEDGDVAWKHARPLRSPSQDRAAAAARDRARAGQLAAERAAAAAAWTDPAPYAAAIRRELGWHQPRETEHGD